MRNALCASGVAILLASASSSLYAAPLAPPAGPVAPTGVTQIFELPFLIDQPGSYRIARDLVMTVVDNGVTITASNVTLDLGGHVLDGGGVGVGVEGILLLGSLEGVTIQNGTITNWQNAAIFDNFDADPGVIVRNIRCTNLGLEGIRLSDSDALVINCVVTNAMGPPAATEGGILSGQGIWLGANSRVVDCKTVNIGDEGILVGDNSVITGCVASGANQTGGVAGIAGGANCVVENSVATGNNAGGFAFGFNALLRGCNASNNVTPIPPAASSMTIDHRTGEIVVLFEASKPRTDPRTGQLIADPIANLFTTEGVAAAEGFVVGSGSRIFDSIANNNSSTGFMMGNDSVVTGCVANANGGDGIIASDDTVVTYNRATSNGGNGIVLNSSGTHCQWNYLSSNFGDGIQINDQFTVVICNHIELDTINNAAGAILVGPTNDLTNPLSNWDQ